MSAGVRYPTPPAPGEPIRATLLREIIDCLKRITPLAGKNTTVDYGPYGARVNRTPAGSSSPAPPGETNPLFAIGSMDDPDNPDETCKGIVNCWYMRGGFLEHADDFKWSDDWKGDGAILAFQIWTDLDPDGQKMDDPLIWLYSSIEELKDAQRHMYVYNYPLYMLDKDGNVKLDLRSLINIQVFELP